MRSDLWLWSLPVVVSAGVLIAFWACDQVIRSFTTRPVGEDESGSSRPVRRGVTGAAFGLQEIIEPGVAHVVRALQDARAEEADPSGGNDDEPPSPDTVLAEVIEVLNRAPVDVEEVRRRLTDASREGFDWRSIYEEAVVAVRAERPYLSPGIPPVSRVAPH